MALWSTIAMATITQGDLAIFGRLDSQWSGRWGEGSARGGTASVLAPGTSTTPLPSVTSPGIAPTETGGSFDFNHWDLVQARQIVDVRPDYHIVKNFKLLGRFDTLLLQDADLFAIYRGWYDAFPDLKHRGRAETARDWTNFTSADRINEFTRNELREYYAQLNFTDNFSMRVGKQQVIWTEADALSGTEVTNPSDLRFHWIHFESAENSRVNLRMVKFNYILPDFLRTTNNELEFFWIPGDWQGPFKAVVKDARNPWIAPVALGKLTLFNQNGGPFRADTLIDQGATPMFSLFSLHTPQFPQGLPGFTDVNLTISQQGLSNSIDNSEFGVRQSTLLPVGNGLQLSLIYLYEARSPKLQLCVNCPAPPNTFMVVTPGVFFLLNQLDFPKPGVSNILGTTRILLRSENVRQHFFGATGTYYDKDLTDIVFRYDFLFAPKIIGGVGGLGGFGGGFAGALAGGGRPSLPQWTEETRWIVAADRPTYIPWISKQHTFLVAQYVATWSPSAGSGARAVDNFFFLAANNWLDDGRWTTLNVLAWEPDTNVGFVSSGNSYRYSANILFGLNAQWYLGRSGRFDDGFGGVLSRGQRINELEFRFTYEI